MALVKCKECGKKVSEQATNCPKCGCPIGTTNTQQPKEGEVIQELEPVKTKKKHGCLVPLIIFVAILAFFALSGKPKTKPTNGEPDLSLYTNAGMEAQGAVLADSAVKACGIDEVITCTVDGILSDAHFEGEKGYRLSTKDINNIILYMNTDNTVYQIIYADAVLYENGAVNAKMSEFTFTSAEIANLQVNCKETVKKVLKSPSSAKFPNVTEWNFRKYKGEITIQSYVDAQNSFGADIRTTFQFILTSDYTIKSFIFDGQEIMPQQ